MGRGHLPLSYVAQDPVQPGLEHLLDYETSKKQHKDRKILMIQNPVKESMFYNIKISAELSFPYICSMQTAGRAEASHT